MSATTALLIVVLLWLAIGVVASIVMGRRGHHPFTWGALGAVLGPFVVALMLRDLRDEAPAHADVLAPGAGRPGLRVLVGVDGSDEARAAIDVVAELFAGRVGRCVLAAVVDFDIVASRASWPERRDAEAWLSTEAERARARLGSEPAQVVLAGAPAAALRDYAAANDIDVLVVGSRGRGTAKRVFGSVAASLSRETPVPVIIVSAAAAPVEHSAA
jgi:nucleotide-binding universal stress UspA family protein